MRPVARLSAVHVWKTHVYRVNDREKSLKLCLAIMAAVDGNGFKLEDDISAKISGFRKEYDNDRDGRDEYGKSL